MANGANIVVPVGVQLELNNVQEIISSLQKAMSNVKPDTKGYAGIVSELSKAEKRAESLASKLSQGFTTKAGLQSFTKGFEDLIAMVDVVNNKVGQINFDNLTLTADQQAKMNEFTKSIQDARDAYSAFETDKLRDAVSASQDLQNVFKKLNLNVDTTSLDSAINSIKTKIASLQKEMDSEAKKATTNEARAASRQSEIDELNRLKKLFTSKDLSKTFPEFFKDTGDFKKGGNQALVNLLKQLGIDNDTIELVKKTAGKKIKEIQAEMEKAINTRIKTKESQRNTASDNAKAARNAVERLTAEQKENINSQQDLQNVQNNPEMVQARKQETDAIEQENVKIRELIQLIMQAFNGGLGKNSNDLKAALDTVRESSGAAAAELENLNQRTKTVENIKRSVSMWMGFNQVLRLTRTAIKNVVKDIRDLDKVMTEIAVVTNMSQKDLWNQMNTYQAIAKQYGVATTGVYQVSQIYYQQGLQTSDVMALTNETLKMAKIAGLDYGAAADYMTVAIRGFKMEMTDAQNVVDVYSNLAAKSASDTTELATAMSKTASSAAAVGSSFENTSAMIAMMVETTRESAENIGSALKSIISRYGEMTSDPSKLVDSEGEALSLNKVDKALQSVGISLHNAQGQFRDFDEVILELSSKWDTLDKNSQRYIATVMAGNRQQSRFLALVSDYDRLSELTEVAANSEDAALVQTLKTMDSLETKIQNVKNAFQGFYGNLGLESVFKGALDVITNIINRLNAMPKAFDKIPIAAIGMVANIINIIKTLGTTLITIAASQWNQIKKIIETSIAEGARTGTQEAKQEMAKLTPEQVAKNKKWVMGTAISTAGAGLSTLALTMKDSQAQLRGATQAVGGLTSGFGSYLATAALMPGVAGKVLAVISALSAAIPGLISGFHDLTHAEELHISALKEQAKQSEQEALIARQEATDLGNTVEKIENLTKAKNDSSEAYQEWLDYVNQVASQYPQLISMYDAEGNAVLDMAAAYQMLAQSRAKAAQEKLDQEKDQQNALIAQSNQVNKALENNLNDFSGENKNGTGLSNSDLSFSNVLFSNSDYNFRINDELAKIFFENTQGQKIVLDNLNSNLKLNLDSLSEIQKLTTEKLENLGYEGADDSLVHGVQQAYGNFLYSSIIEPLAKTDYLKDFGISTQEIDDQLNEIKELYGDDTFAIEQATYEYYTKLAQTIYNISTQGKDAAIRLQEIEKQQAEYENSFSNLISERISSPNVDLSEMTKLSQIGGDKFLSQLFSTQMQATGLTVDDSNYQEKAKEVFDALITWYDKIGEVSYSKFTDLLSHPEQYSSKINFKSALENLGVQLPAEIDNYINNIWEKTNEDLQNSFKNNIRNSNKDNKEISRQAVRLSTIGNGGNRDIAAQYLNDINKQWTDLVTNQKNEAAATQNAKFLADTYTDVSQLSEEANGAMANILSTAELNTREGIQKAIDQIEAYQADNDLSESDAKLLDAILGSLKEHKDNLLLNLNTEFQQYTDSLSEAVKNVNQNYTNNTSGFGELKDANEALQKINSGKLAKDQLTFDEAFKFDENLGKYVFTVQGLMKANNAQMEDINSQYEDATEQLTFSQNFIEATKDSLVEFSKENIVEGLKRVSLNENSKYSEEQRQIIGQIAKDFEESDLEWNEFIENKTKELEKINLSAEQAKVAAENMAKEAQKRNAIESLDISGITKSSKTFSEVEQSIINYLTTGLGFIFSSQEAAEHAALNVYNNLKGGGQEAADFYKRNLANSEDFQAEVYNEILNQPAEASKSLLSKLNNSIGQSSIQLTQAEATLLQELGVENAETSITVDRLREKAGDLFDNLQEAVEQGSVSLADANKEIFENKLGDELKLEKQTSALTSLMTSDDLNISNLENFATALGATAKFVDNFNIDELAGIKELDNGKKIIDPQKIQEFVADFNEKVLGGALEEDDINNIIGSLELADKSKITDAAVQAENSIIESIASEINNIKSAGIDKKVNLTYLQNKLGDNSLTKIFGSAYQDGMLTVTETVKANMYTSLQTLRSELKANNYDTSELDKTLIEYVNSSISEISEFTGAMTVSDNTAQVLASQSAIFKGELLRNGKITLKTAESFARAANAVYTATTEQYQKGLANLTQLNSSYVNIIKSNLAKQTAGFNMLTSASKIDLTSLQNFLNVYNKKLSDYVNKMGNLTIAGAAAGLKSLGNGNYQIADWHKFISQLQITANELSTEYIDAYVSWLQSDANVAPNAKEALMTSLIPNMEKLTYAQIGQIAKTFNMTVDAVLALVENNGDNTFNGANLLNSLDFDKSNKEFSKALIGQKQTLASNLIGRMTAYIEAGSDGKLTSYDTQALSEGVNDYIKGMHALGISVEINSQKMRDILSGGGENAVVLAQRIAAESGQQLSNQDIETLYRSSISSYVNAIDTVMTKPGEIVDRTTANLIRDSGGKVNQLGTTGQFVVESAANLYEAYNNLLQKMAATGEATLADLNKVAALALENRDGEQQVIDALGDASGMTFTRFGEILADAGIQLTEDMVNQLEAAGIIDLMGGNKMKIVDFQAFADLMNWDANSEEYVSAFKSYNDSLIDMNRQAERNILEEAQNVASAKGGDWVNLTQLSNELSKIWTGISEDGIDYTKLDELQSKIQLFGAKIEDGILKLDDSANIPAILQMIAQAAAESGGLLSNELAELADAVADAIKSYADLIKGGIEGSLSNVQAEELQDWATANGIGQLDFTETADGLKVATNQAFELVAALQQVDSMQGKLTFDSLIDSLSESKGGKFENISKTTAEIAKTQREIAENNQKINFLQKDDEKTNAKDIQALKEKNAKLREQIGLYREIQQHQSIDPSQYNFMDRELPDVMQGPINYWNSVGKAYSALNETAKTGKMDIQDFTNIVNEMSNLAATSGEKLMFFGQEIDGSAENAAALIQKGYSALSNVDGKGVKVDLSKMGIDFASGADNAKNNFDKGIKSLAESNIAMLDAAIQVLEVVVAMEELGNIDVDNNGIFSIGDIFGEQVTVGNGEKIDAYTTEFQDYAKKILKAAEANEDLRKGLENFSVNGITLKEMFEDATDRLKDLDISKEAYFAIMNSFVEAAKNGDYNLDTIQDSVWQILDQTLPDGSVINMGERSIIISGGTHTVIDWEDPDVQAVIDEIGGDEEEARKTLEESFQKWQNGTSERIDLERVLKAQGKLTVDKKTGKVTYNGKEYPNMTAALPDIGKDALKQMGATGPFNIEGEGEDITVTSDLQVGQHTIQVKFHDNKETYVDPETGLEAGSLKELVDKIINTKTNEFEQSLHGNATPQQVKEFKEKLQAQLYYEYEISGTETNINGTDEEIRKLLQKSDEEIQKAIDQAVANGPGTDGKYHAKFDDSDIDIEFSDQELNADSVKQKAIEHFKNSAVLAAITQGITEAFTSTNEENGNAVQNAITTAITNAFTQLKDLDEQEIPQVTARITDLQITGVDNTTFGGLNALGSKFGLSSNLTIPEATAKIGNLKISGADTIDTETFKTVGEKIAQAIQEGLASITLVPNVQDPTGGNPTPENGPTETTGGTVHSTAVIDNVDDTALQNSNISIKVPIEADPEAFNTTITGLEQSITVKPQVPVDINPEAFNSGLTTMTTEATKEVKKPVSFDGKLSSSYDTAFKNATSSISKSVNFIGKLTQDYNEALKEATKDAEKKINFVKGTDSTGGVGPKAGNVALAKGQSGEALARGRTLMGELGPELVVSNGRYYVVGQNGPEMVNLAPDAIVFNHLQTRQLLTNGRTGTHATPVTNEKKAVSFATGNATGPAMASASEALATLKQLRAMWESLANASLKDLGGMPSGSGGGGGGGGGNDAKKDAEGVNGEVERWYNWLKLIETTQNNINKLTKEYTLLEKQNISSQKKLNNLQKKFEDLQSNRSTRLQLVQEQTEYRTKLIEKANKNKLFGAFYNADEKTGQISLVNDDSFLNYITSQGKSGELADNLKSNKVIKAGTKIKYSKDMLEQDFQNNFDKKISKAEYKKLSKTDKKLYKKGKNGQYSLVKGAKGKYVKAHQNTPIKLHNEIKTGMDFIDELQLQDEGGNLVHTAKEQLALIKAMGVYSKDLEKGVDKTQEGWEAQIVENWFAKIENDKTEIEALNDSINEQTEAALDDAIAMQEINEQIRELAKPIPGVTEGLEDWYNELKRIEAVQEKINLLSKQNNIFQNDLIANGKAIYENYKAQREELKNQQSLNEDLFKKRVQERKDLVKKYQGLPINYDATTGTATFSEEKINKTISTSYTDTKKVKKSDGNYYEVDEKGRYVDKEGILRDKNGEELNPEEETFGQVQTRTIESTYNTNGKTLPEILTDITKQDATGKTAYNVEQQYDILKGLGLEKYLQYDESGNKIYEDFGELTKEQMEEAVKAGISRIQGAADEINEVTSDINKLTEDGLDIQASMYELDRMMIDNAIEVKNQLKDAIVQEHQDAIDEKNELKDAIQSSADKTVSGLRDSLEKERQVYDNQKSEEELSSLQRQLAIARRSGGSTATIRDLSQKVEDKQRDMYFTGREQQIDTLEEAANKQVEALEEQTNIMQTALDYQVKYGLIWEEVNNKLNTDSATVITDYITQHMPEFLSANSEEQAKLYTEKLESVQLHLANINDENSPFLKMNQVEEDQLTKLTEMVAEMEAIQAKIPTTSSKDTTPEGNKDNGKATGSESQGGQSGGSDGKKDKNLQTGGGSAAPPPKTLSQKEEAELRHKFDTQAAQKALILEKQGIQGARERASGAAKAALDAYEKTSGNEGEKQTVATRAMDNFLRGINNGGSAEQPSNQPEKQTIDSVPVKVKKQISYFSSSTANSKTKKAGYFKKGDTFNAIGLSSSPTYTTSGGKKRYMLKVEKNNKIIYVPRLPSYLTYNNTNKLKKFAQGGKIDFTGPAWVDGSKSKPEQIFNFDQMQQLREMFLNNLAATQMGISGLSSIADSLPNTNAYNNISNEDNGVNIGQLDFHMEVQEISNDYDARRAGYEAMEEMVRIARKAGNRSISRR